jgi:hypothetical protein
LTKPRQNRFKSKGWGRIALSLLVMSWVSAAAQPCRMGPEVAADMPVMTEHSMHDQHASGSDDGHESTHDCGHCPPGGAHDSRPCASMVIADCNEVSDFSVDGRGAKFKLDKPSVQVAVLPDPPPGSVIAAASPPQKSMAPGLLRFAAGPSLSIQYCVFLK